MTFPAVFALASLAAVASADHDFLSTVRQSGICQDQTLLADNERPAGLLGAESLVQNGEIQACECGGLDLTPGIYDHALDLASEHSNFEPAYYKAPGCYVG